MNLTGLLMIVLCRQLLQSPHSAVSISRSLSIDDTCVKKVDSSIRISYGIETLCCEFVILATNSHLVQKVSGERISLGGLRHAVEYGP
jgi:hypothetical protein